MVIDNVFAINNKQPQDDAGLSFVVRGVSAITRQLARIWCGMHGHLIMLHSSPTSFRCSAHSAATNPKDGKSAGR